MLVACEIEYQQRGINTNADPHIVKVNNINQELSSKLLWFPGSKTGKTDWNPEGINF
tara:strand:+ start:1884 stop:2054 length:171 start_codon:yes stop_codon:yes gene_type:complete